MPSREQASEIEDAATSWAAKSERGLATAERTELEHWLEGDSRRLGAFVRAQAAWIHAERAASLGSMPEPRGAPATDRLLEAEAPRRTLNRRMVVAGGGALAASFAGVYIFAASRYRTLESGVGEIRHIALRSGTLTLDTDTRVDVALSSDGRTLELVRGKLFLDVTRWQETPLRVHAGGLVFDTMEGAFGLESLVKSPLTALVTEGRLMVSQAQGIFEESRTVTLEKDHALTLALDGTLLARDVRPVPVAQREQLLAWREGMLSFGGEMLAEAVRAFDRYGPVRIVVADPVLARQKVTGLFKASDPRGFAEAVAVSFGGVVASQGEIIRISARKLPSA